MSQNIELCNLELSPLNVRSVSPTNQADKELIANIRTNGIIQNLVVIPSERKNKFEVIAGGRRLSALQSLLKEKAIDKNFSVPCLITNAANATELSLSENRLRENMHPVDEFLAFKKMLDEGATIKQVANHFGVTQVFVKRRLKMASVAPLILDAFKSGDLDLDCVMAFSVSEDTTLQENCFNELSRGFIHARAIKDFLLKDTVNSADSIVKFVGLTNYKNAGGQVSADLFSNEVFLLDKSLLYDLANQKLTKSVDALKKDGWKWVEVSHSEHFDLFRFIRLDPSIENVPESLLTEITLLKADLDEIEEQGSEQGWPEALDNKYDELDELLAQKQQEAKTFHQFLEDQKAKAGCIVYYNRAGDVQIEYGLMKPADKPLESPCEANHDTPVNTGHSDAEQSGYSNALKADIALYRQQIIQSAIASHTTFAMDLLIFSLCDRLFMQGYHFGHALSLRLDLQNISTKLDDLEQTQAGKSLAEYYKALDLSFMEHDAYLERFIAFVKLEASVKNALMAFCVSRLFNSATSGLSNEAITHFIDTLNINMADFWRPNADNFFSRIGKKDLLALGEEWFGDDWLAQYEKLKKSDAVSSLDGFMSDGPSSVYTEREENIRANWMPQGFLDRPQAG